MSANVNDWLEDLRGTLKDQLPMLQDHNYSKVSPQGYRSGRREYQIWSCLQLVSFQLHLW